MTNHVITNQGLKRILWQFGRSRVLDRLLGVDVAECAVATTIAVVAVLVVLAQQPVLGAVEESWDTMIGCPACSVAESMMSGTAVTLTESAPKID